MVSDQPFLGGAGGLRQTMPKMPSWNFAIGVYTVLLIAANLHAHECLALVV